MRWLFRTDAGFGMTILRIATGAVFIPHGAQKLFGWFDGGGIAGTTESFSKMGIEPAQIMAILAGCAEFFGGILLVIGLFARVAGLSLVIAMLVAIFVVHLDNGMVGPGGYQWALMMCAASAAVLVDGAGKLSADQMLGR